jgi:hypothetical protein
VSSTILLAKVVDCQNFYICGGWHVNEPQSYTIAFNSRTSAKDGFASLEVERTFSSLLMYYVHHWYSAFKTSTIYNSQCSIKLRL